MKQHSYGLFQADSGYLAGLVVFVLLAFPFVVQADIYKYVDKHGRVVLTDRPKNSNYKRLVKTWKGWVEQPQARLSSIDFIKNKKKFTPTVEYMAKRYNLPNSLVHAVITAESSYDPAAVSRAGAVGLMQLMPETAKRYGVKDRLNPYENIHGGTHYLRDLLIMFENDLTLALAAYNAGENAVKKYGNKIPPYQETRNYVNKVIKYYKQYQNTNT